MKRCVSFDDVLLVPKYSTILSRKDISLQSRLGHNLNFDLPIISAPMDTETEEEMADSINASGGLGIIHRYNTIEEQVEVARKI